jgi:hypothetical protein
VLSVEPLLARIISSLPLDTFVGVRTHHLNELWSSSISGFSDWLHHAGRRFTRGEYGVHISGTTRHNKIKDTFFCFSGPGVFTPPWSRGIKFKLLDITDVNMLSTPGVSAHERIVRLLKRELEERSIGKMQDFSPTPIKAKKLYADNGSSVGSGDMDAGSSHGCAEATVG